MKILLVEDELNLQKAIEKGLTKRKYLVDVASDGNEAVDLFYTNTYDLIILDLNLPHLDGLEVLKIIREDDEQIRVLILSARSELDEKVVGLESGANDYISKPFYFKELEARVDALLRRSFNTQNKVINIEDVDIYLSDKKVFVDNQEIDLTSKEYSILEYLAINRGRIISMDELYDHVWKSEGLFNTNSIKVHLNRIRNKTDRDIIQTKRKEGYYVK